MLERALATKLVEDLVSSYVAYESLYTAAKPLMGDIVDSPLMQIVSEILDRQITAVEYAIGDVGHTWVYWFVWETACGAKPMEAYIDKVEYPVRSVPTFIDLLVALEFVC